MSARMELISNSLGSFSKEKNHTKNIYKYTSAYSLYYHLK